MHLDALRRELGDLMRAWEAKGLDFAAPGGETPRAVQRRVLPFLKERAAAAGTVAVAHKGVIRAVYALATGWDMTGPPAHKLREPCAHLFGLAPDGMPSVRRLNIPLKAGGAA
jgi:probable phosphoglycerate mutase